MRNIHNKFQTKNTVKAAAVIMVMAVCRCSYADEPDVRSASIEQLRGSFAYGALPAPATSQVPLDSSARIGDEVVQMDSVVVIESIRRKDLEKAVRDQAKAASDRQFSWANGGLLASKKIGPVRADLGLWPKIETNSVGQLGSKGPMLRVDILHLRW